MVPGMRVRLNAAKKQFDIFSQARKGAVKGSSDASAFECGERPIACDENHSRRTRSLYGDAADVDSQMQVLSCRTGITRELLADPSRLPQLAWSIRVDVAHFDLGIDDALPEIRNLHDNVAATHRGIVIAGNPIDHD